MADSVALSLLVVFAAALRFWRLGIPAEVIYDEKLTLGQARPLVLGWPPSYSSHPPLGKEVVALSIWLFGDYPWGWRALNASLGTALVAITYLLGRRMFRARPPAAIAAAFILCDGLFLVASRVALINITFVTLAAWAFLLAFRFIDQSDPNMRRRTLLAMGLVLGLCAGGKAAIPEVAALLAAGAISFALLREGHRAQGPSDNTKLAVAGIINACGLLGAIMLIVYIAAFSPFYWYGWWSGIGDLANYHRWALHTNLRLPRAVPRASPFWSWPLLLRPYPYWEKFSAAHSVAMIWSGGNPLLWWEILAAIPIAIARAYRQRKFAWAFLAIGYFAYMAMWIPIRRYLFIYDYMPAAYLGLIALGGALAECWEGAALRWEQILLLIPLAPCLVLGLGRFEGGAAALAVALAYLLAVAYSDGYEGKFVFAIFGVSAIVLCIYFFPIWTGMPISQPACAARMWFHGAGLANWM